MKQKSTVPILVADDDLDDCEVIREAWRESRLLNELHFVHNGEELMDYLEHRGKYQDRSSHPAPGLILMDLNMPRVDGREVLEQLKKNPKLRRIPVVVLTTSQAEEDVFRTYNLGVNSYVTKPVAFDDLVQVIRDLGRYWFEIVELPHEKDADESV